MRLPEDLLAALEQETAQANFSRLTQAASQFSQQYRAGDFSAPPIKTEIQRAAYMAVRLPATYAATWHVFSEVRRLAPDSAVHSILDLGAGPGTAVHAAAEIFPGLGQATLVESDSAWLAAGQRIAEQCSSPALQSARWILGDLRRNESRDNLPTTPDLVVIAYALGELHHSEATGLVVKMWELCAKFLVIIEPGTTRGFSVVNATRSALIAQGARLLAPCPHQGPCPMAVSGDWCHFSQRLERTALHRRLKGGDLGYEDEKFSYVVASKVDAAQAPARIVRHPQKHSGHVKLTLCTPQGLEARTVTRSQKQSYKQARQADWGNAWGDASNDPRKD